MSKNDGLHFADGVLIALRIINRKKFQPGPFRLGAWQLPVNIAAISWVVISSVRLLFTFHQ